MTSALAAGVEGAPGALVVPVQLDGVVARDAAGPRGSARGTLHGVTAALGPGVNVFLGAPEDGTIALCDAIAGVRRVVRGAVRVAGGDPWSVPAVRGRIGALLASPDLPEATSVRACVGQALAAMGGAAADMGAERVLGELGLGGLAVRRVAALSFAEARAVELALAIAGARSAPAPAVAVLYEPFGDMAVPGGARVIDEAIGGLRAAGACVVIATSSSADARRLADVLWILSRGGLVRREVDGKALAVGEAEVVAWVGGGAGAGAAVRALAAAVAQSPAVRSAWWEDAGPGAEAASAGRRTVLRLRGADRDACALAVLDAAASAGVAVEAITSSVPELGHVRSAALARYQQAQMVLRAAVGMGPGAGVRPAAMGPTSVVAGGASGSPSISAAQPGAPGSPPAIGPGPIGASGSPPVTDPDAREASGSPPATGTGAPEHLEAPPEDENRSIEGFPKPPGVRFGPIEASGSPPAIDPDPIRASGSPPATETGAPEHLEAPADRDGSSGGGPS